MTVHLFKTTESWRSRNRGEYQYEEVSHEGLVLRTGSESVQIMSDVWGTLHFAEVWNPETGRPERVVLKTVDHQVGLYFWYDWTKKSYATVDATPEVVEAHETWKQAQEETRTQAAFEANVERGLQVAREVKKGSLVVVVRGRKVPKGTKGRVFWTGSNHYGDRVGVQGDDGQTHWTATRNVEVEKGHEDWSGTCPTCGGTGWVPARDGKGGTKACKVCERRAEEAAETRRQAEEARQAVEADVADVRKGSRVVLPNGTTGRVFWLGQNKYGPGLRVGVQGDDGQTHWAGYEEVRAAA